MSSKIMSLAVKGAALAGAAFVAWIENAFVRSWSNTGSMYGPVGVGVIGATALLLGLFPLAGLSRLRLAIVGSGLVVISVCWFLIEIVPIASGNNDSGEVFWIVTLPAILLFIYLCSCYLKVKKFIPSR